MGVGVGNPLECLRRKKKGEKRREIKGKWENSKKREEIRKKGQDKKKKERETRKFQWNFISKTKKDSGSGGPIPNFCYDFKFNNQLFWSVTTKCTKIF